MPPPRFYPLIRLILCVIGISVLCSVAFAVVMAALMTVASLTGRPSASYVTASLSNNALLTQMLLYPPALLWMWFCRRALDRRSFVSLGLRRSRSVRDLALGAACGTLAIAFLSGVLWLTGHFSINGWSPAVLQSGPFAALSMLALYAGVFCAVGFMEEIAFRGYALHNLAAWMGIRVAVVVQAVIFALIHLPNAMSEQRPDGTAVARPTAEMSGAMWDARWAMVNILLIGLFFALCYLKTGSLWFPIGFHAAWNFVLGCIFSLPVSGIGVFRLLDVTVSSNTLVTGGEFGAEGSILLIPIIGVLLLLLRRQPDHAQAGLDLALLQTPRHETPRHETLPRDTSVSASGIEPPIPHSGSLSNSAASYTAADAAVSAAVPSAEEPASRFRTTMRPREPLATQDAPPLINTPPAHPSRRTAEVQGTEVRPSVEPPLSVEPLPIMTKTDTAPAAPTEVPPAEPPLRVSPQHEQRKAPEEPAMPQPVETQPPAAPPITATPPAAPAAKPVAKPAKPPPKW